MERNKPYQAATLCPTRSRDGGVTISILLDYIAKCQHASSPYYSHGIYRTRTL